jgi:hypothetical protein
MAGRARSAGAAERGSRDAARSIFGPLVASETQGERGRRRGSKRPARADGRRSSTARGAAAWASAAWISTAWATAARGRAARRRSARRSRRAARHRQHRCGQRHSRLSALRRAGGADQGGVAPGLDERSRHSRFHWHCRKPVGFHRPPEHSRLWSPRGPRGRGPAFAPSPGTRSAAAPGGAGAEPDRAGTTRLPCSASAWYTRQKRRRWRGYPCSRKSTRCRYCCSAACRRTSRRSPHPQSTDPRQRPAQVKRGAVVLGMFSSP